MSFSVQKRGFFKGCRLFIGVYGCHLKGKYGKVLLSVMSMDANNEIFPIAFAITESENEESWTWFFKIMKDYLRPCLVL